MGGEGATPALGTVARCLQECDLSLDKRGRPRYMRILDRKWVSCSLNAWEYLIFIVEFIFPPNALRISALMSLHTVRSQTFELLLSLWFLFISGLNLSY